MWRMCRGRFHISWWALVSGFPLSSHGNVWAGAVCVGPIQKDIRRAVPFILGVVFFNSSHRCWNRLPCFPRQLFAEFVHAYDWLIRVVWSLVYVQYILHVVHKITILCRCYAPFFV